MLGMRIVVYAIDEFNSIFAVGQGVALLKTFNMQPLIRPILPVSPLNTGESFKILFLRIIRILSYRFFITFSSRSFSDHPYSNSSIPSIATLQSSRPSLRSSRLLPSVEQQQAFHSLSFNPQYNSHETLQP
jgi:hypothetical protein